MSPKKLRENLEAVRAKAFTVNLSDGRQFSVPHTDYKMLTANAEQVILLELWNYAADNRRGAHHLD